MSDSPSIARSRLWPALLFLACLAATALLWASRGWIWLGVPPINEARTPFSDTMAHIGTAVNCANGAGEWHGRVCFIPNMQAVPRAQTYEPWLTFERWGLDDERDMQVSAVVIVLLFLAALALTFRPRSAGEAVLVVFAFLTTGVQLAIERGNFDLLTAALICAAGALLGRRPLAAGIAGAAVLSFATMLKLYTGLACALAWRIATTSSRTMLPIALLALALAIAVVGPRELLVLGQGAPEGATRFSTGARWLFLRQGATWGAAAIVLAIAAGLYFWARLRAVPAPRFARWPQRVAVFQVAFLTAVPLFLLKDSYDYRLVLWLPCLALPLAWLRHGEVAAPWRRLAVFVFACWFAVAGMELPCFWLDRLASAQGWTWPNTLASALALAKQFASWLLAALLTLIFAWVQLGQRRSTDPLAMR